MAHLKTTSEYLVHLVPPRPHLLLLASQPTSLFTMKKSALATALDDPITIHFLPDPDGDKVDFGGILVANPQKVVRDGYAWYLPDSKTDATVMFVGKISYDGIGNKIGPYFNIFEQNLVRIFLCILYYSVSFISSSRAMESPLMKW